MAVVKEVPHVSLRYESGSGPRDLPGVVSDVRVQHRLSLPSLCEVVLQAPDSTLALESGSVIAVSVFSPGVQLFEGHITAVSYERDAARQTSIRIRAYDRTQQLRQRQSVRDFVSKSTRDVVTAIAEEISLSVDLSGTGPLWHHLVQLRQNDFEFLREIAARSGLYFFLEGKVLKFVTLEGDGTIAELALEDSLLEVRFEQNVDRTCRTVEANGWNPWDATGLTATASQPRSARPRMSSAGLDLKIRSFGTPYQSVEQAQAHAQSELDHRVSREMTVWGIADGNIHLHVGGGLEVSGVNPATRGPYVLSSVTHTIDERNGFLTEFDSLVPQITPRRHDTEVTVAKVTRVDDPKKLGRLKLKLTCYDDIETDWLEVVLPAAGHNKGLIALPDVGDDVLVLLVSGDPSQGIVLGCLFGTGAPDELGVDGNNVRQYFLRTPGGQQICLDDADDSLHLVQKDGARIDVSKSEIHLETAAGSYFAIKHGETILHSQTDLTIEAPGKRIRIAADSVDFDRT